MAKILVFDKCIVDDNDAVSKYDPEELFGASFPEYIEDVNDGNLDHEHFNIEDVDTSVFIIDDGGELFRLKNGTYINVCWRGSYCRVWPEDDQEMIDIYNEKLGKTNTIEEDLIWTPISVENEINLALQEQSGWFDASDFTKEDRKKVAELIVAQSDKPWTSSDIRDFVLDICKEDGNWKYVLEQYDIVFEESLTEETLEEKLTWDKIEQALWSKEYNGPVHSEINYGCLRGFESRLDASQAADFIEKKFKVECDVERDPLDNDGWVVKVPNVVDESLDEANKGSNFIDEEGRKKELSELRAILKKYLSQEKEWEEPVTEWDRNITKYDALSWYQNIRPALKNGLVKCDYKIRWSPLKDKSLQKNLMGELKAWKNKSNPNRIYSDLGKGGLDLMYNYKKFNTDESLIEAQEEAKLETFEDKMDFLAKDEQEAIDGYDKVIAMLNPEEDGFVIEQLTKIKVEEEAHKKYLEDVKTNKELEYTEPLEQEDKESAVIQPISKKFLDSIDDKKDESLKEEAEEETTSEEPRKEEKTEPKIISDGLGQRRADKLAAMLNEENPDGVNGPFAEEPATSEDATVEISSQAGYEKTKFNDDGSIDVEYHWAEGFWNEETGELEDLDGEETFETLEEWISHAEQNTFFLNIDLGELENVK